MRFFAIASLVFTAATSVFAGPIVRRDNSPAGVASILTTLNAQVKPYTTQLTSFTSEQATMDNIKPAVDGITSAVQTAISDLKALKGQSTDVIMASVDGSGTTTVSEVSGLLSETVGEILGAVGSILSVVTDDVLPAVTNLLTALCYIVSELLGGVSELVMGVLEFVSDALDAVAWVISELDLTEVYETVVGYSISN